MAAIDRNRIIEKTAEELDEFTCGICQDIFKSPKVTPCCRQTYCKDCITEWLTTHNTCPNDRQPLTTSRLTDAPRLVVNVIDKMKIKCAFNEKGCPSVHTIAQDVNHLDVCPFAKCGQCGCKAPDSDHNCLSYLSQKIQNLIEDNEKAIKIKELALVEAITKAKGKECLVNEIFGLHQSWDMFIINNCKDVIEEFSAGEHSSKQFADMIKARLNSRNRDISWSVSVYANEFPAWKPIDNFVRLVFGRLVIVCVSNPA